MSGRRQRARADGASKLEKLFSPRGRLARELAGYERRREQMAVLRAAIRALGENGVLLAEAGTGVGKSLAYGIPAADWALTRGEPVVISTATINLQEQLVQKDLPLIARVMGGSLRSVLVKGRGNYLCRRRLAEGLRQGSLFSDEEGALDRLARFAETTQDGSRSDLTEPVPAQLWEEVSSDADACPGRRCPFRKTCFFRRARRDIRDADILVVNHHLLFADLAVRLEREDWQERAVLPAFTRVVLDEAHELEDAASQFFGERLTRRGLLWLLGRLAPSRQRGRSGILEELARELEDRTPLRALAGVADCRRRCDRAFAALASFVAARARSDGPFERRLRLTPETLAAPDFLPAREELLVLAERLQRAAEDLAAQLERIRLVREEDGAWVEARGASERLRRSAAALRRLIDPEDEEWVRWVEIDAGRSGRCELLSAPLRVGPILRRALLEPMGTVIFTSATLSVGGDFGYFVRQCGADGIDPARVQRLRAASPFQFERQALLAVPTDMPDPRESSFERELPRALVAVLQASGGRALVLFTSHALLRRAAEALRPELAAIGIRLLAHGEAPRDWLLDEFRRDETSVLLGADSFWQGVDVPGAALCNVVITRLPFDVPEEPLQQARAEAVEQSGGSSFEELSLPRAVLRLKQGFGRLIRNQRDFGAVVVLDRRLLTRSYGRLFLESLPPAPLCQGPLDEVCDRLARFFSERTGAEPRRVVSLSPDEGS
jgi:ATP-dependent DNA helicase DinG